ncbi:PSR1 [Symbiodinium sp. CCMP2456]|nr:PSR1 [Symbiodinium sp. CCMP2456]
MHKRCGPSDSEDESTERKRARLQRALAAGTFPEGSDPFPESALALSCGSCATPLWKTAASQKNSLKEESRAPPRPPLRDFSVSMPRLSLSDVDLNLLPQQVKAALDFLVLLNPCDIVTDALAAQQPTLLPPQQEAHRGRRTLVLDLDETLVHCHCQAVPSLGSADLDLELESGEPKVVMKAKVYVRPSARRLLLLAAEKFEVVVFTASASIYADKVLDFLDPGRILITHRLYREACTEIAGGHFKDLRKLGRPMKDVLLVDNSPLAPGLVPENGLLVSSWYGDDWQDTELNSVAVLLNKLAAAKSLPQYLEQRYGFKSFLQELRSASVRNTKPLLSAATVRLQMWGMNAGSAVTQVRRR